LSNITRFITRSIWRGWVDWGQGALGDMGAHLIDHRSGRSIFGMPTAIRDDFDAVQLLHLSGSDDDVLRVRGARKHAGGEADVVRRRVQSAQAGGDGDER
jgi:hypothetical protein